MSIADQLNQLNTIRLDIIDAISGFGVSITSGDGFSVFAEKINEISVTPAVTNIVWGGPSAGGPSQVIIAGFPALGPNSTSINGTYNWEMNTGYYCSSNGLYIYKVNDYVDPNTIDPGGPMMDPTYMIATNSSATSWNTGRRAYTYYQYISTQQWMNGYDMTQISPQGTITAGS